MTQFEARTRGLDRRQKLSSKTEVPAKPEVKKKKGHYHHGNLREALVIAAKDLLETEGTQSLSLRAVARRAGVSQTAPYRHFSDKEALLASVAQWGFELLAQVQKESLQSLGDRDDRITALGKSYVQFALDHPNVLRLMFGPTIICKEDYAELKQAAEESFGVVQSVVTQAVEASGSKDINPQLATIGAWSLVHGISTLLLDGHLRKGMTENELNIDQFVESITAIYTKGLIG